MKTLRLASLMMIAASVVLWTACGSHAGDGGRTIGGGGTSATYLVSADAVANAVETNTIAANGAIGSTNASSFTTSISQPRRLAVASNGKWIYVINTANGAVVPLSIDTSGKLQAAGSSVTDNQNPYTLTVDPALRFVAVANQTSSSVSFYSINSTTGALAELSISPLPVGVLPSAVAVSGNLLFVSGTSQLAAFSYDATSSTFTQVTGSPFSAGATGTSIVDLAVGPDAAHVLYGADSTGNAVQVYSFDSTTGAIGAATTVPAGTGTSALIVDPSSKFLFAMNSSSNNISVYSIDATTGALTQVSGSPFAVSGSPQSLAFDATNNLLFVSYPSAAQISAFTVNMTTGALTAAQSSAVTNAPAWIGVAKP